MDSTLAKFDIEVFLDSLTTLISTNLNTKIGEIRTEKSLLPDDLPDVNAANPVIFSMEETDTVIQFPFLLIWVVNVNSTSAQARVSHEIEVLVMVGFADAIDTAKPAKVRNKILRYGRAIIEICNENFRKPPFNHTSGFEANHIPLDQVITDYEDLKGGGIFLKTTIVE